MRLIACLVIRHDADLIGPYVTHHLRQGFDGFAILDHRADSDVIRAALARTGAEAVIVRQESADFPQGRWMTELAHVARVELGADWVFPLDADEFVLPVRLPDVRAVVAALPTTTGALSIRRYNMLPPLWPRRSPAAVRSRLRGELNFDGGPLLPKVAARAVPGLTISDGSHHVAGVSAPAAPCGDLEILHVPFRSWRQFTRKIDVGAEAIRMTTGLQPNTGRHWRKLAEAAGDRRLLRQELPLLADSPLRRIRSRLAGTHVRDDRLVEVLRS